MHPLIAVLRLGERAVPIGSYGAMLTLAVLLGAALTLRAAGRAGLDPGAVISALGSAVAGGFVGAWLLQLLVQWARLGSLQAALARPGLVFFGAALGGAAALTWSCRWLRLPALTLLDLAVPAVAVAHAVGRVGCLLGGCCFGAPGGGPLGVRYTHPLAPATALGADLLRHPVQLYEAAGLLALSAYFASRPPAEPGSGRRALRYVLAYSVLRLSVEPLRGDAVRGSLAGGLVSTSQLIALVLLLLSAWALRGRRRAAA
ncbi:MAG: prolipoprotein diacylglyceryl transferase [Myxococcales bacterium]|jgi:phosphatidylglycerol:prolipoprotein diacylglycerol transferase